MENFLAKFDCQINTFSSLGIESLTLNYSCMCAIFFIFFNISFVGKSKILQWSKHMFNKCSRCSHIVEWIEFVLLMRDIQNQTCAFTTYCCLGPIHEAFTQTEITPSFVDGFRIYFYIVPSLHAGFSFLQGIHLHVARGIERGSEPSVLDHFKFVTTSLTQIGYHKKNHACAQISTIRLWWNFMVEKLTHSSTYHVAFNSSVMKIINIF